MGEKDDYLTSYRVFFENFAATVDPEDQLPVNIAGYTITESELPGEVIYWTTQYLTEKQCPLTLMIPLQRIILDEVQVAAKQYPYEFGFDEEESEYIALRLMQAVTARVNDICLRYLDNSRLDTLPPPPPLELRGFPTSASVTKNSRRAMEDRHFEIGNLEALFGIETTTPTSFYGVYDGHAGAAAATYCAAHLHQYLAESAHFAADLPRALHHAFLRTDTDFVRKTNQKRAGGGSTAVVVCVRERRLVAAWAGDSLALLAKRMRLMQIVHAHKPDRPDEKKRIEASGGKVMYWGTWRVNGQLAVSRAIGDAQYKPYVTAQPEIAVVDLDGDEDFVVVGCDGLWDFVSEDVVALTVYKTLANDPNDLKAVTKNLLIQAKNQGSEDNISVIVVFLKDPRDIAADNTPPMELGLDNAVVTAPPFSVENDDRKADNVCVDNASDSDSDDLGPETAVDVDGDDVDADRPEPAAPTPPAHAVEANQIDGGLVDNVAESGEESEDEWNYYKGEGEREQTAEEVDEAPRSETPGQDNSAWESSSVDMNSSPLNPDAPVFVPGGVGGSDLLLAESPRKPLPMDDIELPEEAQFETEAHIRPAELDNCDQLNGHHNLSMEGVTEHLNGNSKNTMDSLGFGFDVGIEQDKIKDTSLIQDFERIQKDTTDFCNIQVFQAHETNPFSVEGNEELFERLKNKERDPMSMSFYQEKDDDTCERFAKPEACVDLNSVQPLPESDDEDIATNGVCQNLGEEEKENFNPESKETEVCNDEPNNDIVKQNIDHGEVMGNNFVDFNFDSSNNMQNYSQDFDSNLPQESVIQTDTPESHKLLFEQIPEIPDGKSSELGFNNEDVLDPESERDLRVATPQDVGSQDIEMDSKSEDLHQENEIQHPEEVESLSNKQFEDDQNEIVSEIANIEENNVETSPLSPEPEEQLNAISPEVNHENIIVDVHCNSETQQNDIIDDEAQREDVESELLEEKVADELLYSKSPLPAEPLENQSQSPSQTPQIPSDELLSSQAVESPPPSESPVPSKSPLPREASPLREPSPARDSLLPSEPEVLQESQQRDSPSPCQPAQDTLLPSESTLPSESPLPAESPLPTDHIPEPSHVEDDMLGSKSPLLDNIEPEIQNEPVCQLETLPVKAVSREPSPLPAEIPLPRESPIPAESPAPEEPQLCTDIDDVSHEQISQAAPTSDDSIAERQSNLLDFSDYINNEQAQEIVEQKESIQIETEEVCQRIDSYQIESAPSEATERLTEPLVPASPSPVQDGITSQTVELVASPAPAELPLAPAELPPDPVELPPAEDLKPEAAPTPDIVPESRNRTELVTDIDIPESHAQEICVPVSSEIAAEEAAPAATPPPTPAVQSDPAHDAPIAAAIAGAAAVAAVGAAAAGAAAASAAAASTKTASPKKSPAAAPKSATKTAPKVGASAPPRTPGSATKRPAATATKSPAPAAARPAAPRTPASATKTTPAKPAPKPATPKPAASPAAPTTKAAAKPATAAPARAAPASRPTTARPAPKPAAPRSAPTAAKASAPAAPKPAAPKPAAPAAKPAAAPRAAPRTAPARAPPTAAPPKPKETKPKPAEAKKPLTNGDVKPAAKSAAPRAPAPRPPAQRPAPRAPAPAATTKPAAPKPPVRAPLDKQSKDLANKRITAKAAPPRTAPIKAPPKTTARAPIRKPAAVNGTAPLKPPPSPPSDNALLPDVIA